MESENIKIRHITNNLIFVPIIETFYILPILLNIPSNVTEFLYYLSVLLEFDSHTNEEPY